ncbi:MAG: ABC transporter ATP-binding protein [Gammaproteobacteria bacterium]|nr:ABC transporter ATP-binding protein [Gammaproteobacteria bacterium]
MDLEQKKQNETLLVIDSLSTYFHSNGDEVEAVKGVSLELRRGETLALVGESGSGKTVIALSVMQLLPYPRAYHPGGSIRFGDSELIGANRSLLTKVRGDRIGMIFQEPMTSLNPLHTVEKQIGEVLIVHKGLTRSQARERSLELLRKVRIRDPEKRLASYPHQLSGGQRQRVMIAMALANDPDILIADEPTTSLDVTIQAQILGLLKTLQQEMGMAVLLITHDLGIVEKVSDHVAVMQGGEIVEQGATRELLAAPQHSYTRLLLEAEPKGKPVPGAADAPEVISCENLRVWFPVKRGLMRRTVDHIKAVDGISLRLQAGHTLGVVGESGSGKTTLALALLHLTQSEGVVLFDGIDISSHNAASLKQLRRRMQVVFQDPYGSLSPRLSIREIVEEGLVAHNIGNEQEREQRVIDILAEVGIDPDSRDRYPHEFSGGQRQRIAIARAIIMQPHLVIFDEPTSALDRSVQAQIIDLLRDLQQKHNLAYIFISHDLKVVRALSDNLIVMQDGKTLEQGRSEEIFEKPQHPYTKRLIKAAFNLEADALEDS